MGLLVFCKHLSSWPLLGLYERMEQYWFFFHGLWVEASCQCVGVTSVLVFGFNMDGNQSSYNHTLNVTFDVFETFTRALYVYGIPLICSFGILGNVICFKVFTFTTLSNQSSSTYIAALSVSDAGFLCSLLLSWFSNGRIGLQFGHHPVWCHFMIYVTYVCSFLSVWYVVLIMFDRYVVTCICVCMWCVSFYMNKWIHGKQHDGRSFSAVYFVVSPFIPFPNKPWF